MAPHPLARVAAFETHFPGALGELATTPRLQELLRRDAPAAPLAASDAIRAAIRDMLRHGGYKPTGRGKPASEYLLRTVTVDGALPAINAAVDACNAVSLHSGIPISVVDLDRARAPFAIGVAEAGMRYVFNAAGQEIDLAGLICLFDADGPCANAVKDAQRTKTRDTTRRTLSVLWAAAGLEAELDAAVGWYRDLLAGAGATTRLVLTHATA
jgi:DNA/RNA-binding domain of Phe-tRNA-synthetase-like protein